MKYLFSTILLIFFILLLYPNTSLATCCEQIIDGKTSACNDDIASQTACAEWGGSVYHWYPENDCNLVNDCTELTGETPIAEAIVYDLEVPLGNTTSVTGVTEYIKILYRFGIGLIALMALFLIVFNGINWILAGGNEQRISTAKKGIVGAVIGLVLALSSFVILNTINPKLISLDEMEIPLIQLAEEIGGSIEECMWAPYLTESMHMPQVIIVPDEVFADTEVKQRNMELNPVLESTSRSLSIDPVFIKSVIYAESSFEVDVESKCGAYGIIQIQPDTALGLGLGSFVGKGSNPAPESCLTPDRDVCQSPDTCGDCDTYSDECKKWIAANPELWIGLGAKYLDQNYSRDYIHGDLALTAASYNAGPGAVQKAGGMPDISETIAYVNRIGDYYEETCDYIRDNFVE